MAQKQTTVRALEHAARVAARSAVLEAATLKPELVANRLMKSPHLINGLRDLEAIVEALIQGGQRNCLTALADTRVLGMRERTIIVEKLLVS